jgi:hypothetical protein
MTRGSAVHAMGYIIIRSRKSHASAEIHAQRLKPNPEFTSQALVRIPESLLDTNNVTEDIEFRLSTSTQMSKRSD